MNYIRIRKAVETDVSSIHSLVRELAIFEKAESELIATPDDYLRDGFGTDAKFQVIVAETMNSEHEANLGTGNICGIAMYYWAYSSWKGRMLYLDDLIVQLAQRGNKIGRDLFEEVIRIAHRGHAQQMRWHILDWNHAALEFYKKFNAELDNEWITGKLTKSQLSAFTKK